MSGSYSYVRFRWWGPINLDDLKKRLKEEGYEVKEYKRPESKEEISLYKDQRNEISIESDTLKALFSPFRGLLTQPGETRPFTEKDMELRGMLMRVYPHSRPTPFPWSFSIEPEFEVEK